MKLWLGNSFWFNLIWFPMRDFDTQKMSEFPDFSYSFLLWWSLNPRQTLNDKTFVLLWYKSDHSRYFHQRKYIMLLFTEIIVYLQLAVKYLLTSVNSDLNLLEKMFYSIILGSRKHDPTKVEWKTMIITTEARVRACFIFY